MTPDRDPSLTDLLLYLAYVAAALVMALTWSNPV